MCWWSNECYRMWKMGQDGMEFWQWWLAFVFLYKTKVVQSHQWATMILMRWYTFCTQILGCTWSDGKPVSGRVLPWCSFSSYLLESMLPCLSLLYNKTNKKNKPSFIDTAYEVASGSGGLKQVVTRNATWIVAWNEKSESPRSNFSLLHSFRCNYCISWLMRCLDAFDAASSSNFEGRNQKKNYFPCTS